MRYLLDTCVVSDFVKGVGGTEARLKSVSPSEVCTTTITVMELLYGLALNPKGTQRVAEMIHAFIEAVQVVPYSREAAVATAELRAKLKKAGKPVGFYDILIAGVALSNGLTLVTSNTAEFSRIKGLTLENWR